MNKLTTAAILSALWATSAGAAVIQFDTKGSFSAVTVAEAAANAASPKGTATGFGKVPGPAKGNGGRSLASSVGGGSIGMWTKPQNAVVAPATGGASGSLAPDTGGGLGVAPLPGALVLLLGAIGALLVGSGLRRRRTIS